MKYNHCNILSIIITTPFFEYRKDSSKEKFVFSYSHITLDVNYLAIESESIIELIKYVSTLQK